MTPHFTAADWGAVTPLFVLGATGVIVLIADLVAKAYVPRSIAIAIAVLGTLAAGVLCLQQYGVHYNAFGSGFVVDETSVLFEAIVLLGVLGSVILYGALGDARHVAAAIALMLWSASGAMLMAGAGSLMTIFLGLELLSLALYTLCGIADRASAREAALKYLLLSSTASGFLLFGMALLFGASGSVALASLANPSFAGDTLYWIGFGLFFVGVTFKLSLVPFHTWAPDVYAGAPLPVTAFMSVVTKAGVLAVLIRIVYGAIAQPHAAAILLPVWIVAGISMIAGNVGMLAQHDLKRMLAYSGISQIGYVLAAVAGGTSLGFAAAIYYFAAYSFMNLGAFAVAALLSSDREEGSVLANYAGLGYRRPWLAFAMSVFLLAMAGLPPTAGFLGKIFILRSSVANGYAWLAALLVIGTAISLYAYGRIIRSMYSHEPHHAYDPRPSAPLAAISAAICAIVVIVLTFYPFVP
ncbi:MAG: NADH-quinone oxidoreductase subunit N [Candidatus Tyrphobacter sp.]